MTLIRFQVWVDGEREFWLGDGLRVAFALPRARTLVTHLPVWSFGSGAVLYIFNIFLSPF